MPTAEEMAARIEALEAKLTPKPDIKPDTTPPPVEPKSMETTTYSRSQIRTAVTNGEITEDEGETIWEQQQERLIEERVTKKLAARQADKARETTIMSEVKRYHEKVPALSDTTSDDAKAVAAEAERLKDMGVTDDMRVLGLMALRGVFGKHENIPKRVQTEEKMEAHEEGASGAEERVDTKEPSSDGAPSGLSARQKSHYARLIDVGVYSGWGAVKEELK